MSQVQDLVHDLAELHGRTRESLLPIFQGVIEKERYLSDEAMTQIASELDISAAQVYGTATFYAFLDVEPRGKHVIRLCRTITCEMKEKRDVLNAIENHLKIKVGETSRDNQFTLLETNCLGQCHMGPAMLINDKVYNQLTPEKVVDILNSLVEYKSQSL